MAHFLKDNSKSTRADDSEDDDDDEVDDSESDDGSEWEEYNPQEFE